MTPARLSLVTIAAFALAPAALAQAAPENSLAFGFALVPDYDGSADYSLRPAINGSFSFGDVTLDLRGTGLRADLIAGPVAAGPVLNYRFGRSSDVDNPQVAALPETEDALELGAFVSVPLNGTVALSADLLADVSGTHDGVLASLSADWRQPVSDRMAVFASASVSAMDANFAQTYYGITAAGAAASGLPAYAPGGGLRDAGLTLGASYDLTDRTTLTAAIGYRRLLGDAADSPIVQAGDRDQMTLRLGLGWAF
ncbi:hypothetical protein C0V75_00915 [Tabrizicola sp. TH137]|uniref:MipA/OmpV family protein n=1 Tax=Tabrizicola sp. TH137 TaxID=2067452 RepID=UPI000C79A2CA|nr:MipA/OmpV family protein [Tabrizicola sp. TH137]PLL14044.1 hypothetical protein C0V75_00915 [Tabrizicola sp. TH137]